jgi:ATP-dependent Clp protease ATP-binding subunit ClpA
VISRVVDKFVLQLGVQLGERDVNITVTDEARTWLAEKGYDELYGARPLGRLIQESIKKPLAEELLFGKLAKGGNVRVKVEGGKLAFDYPAPPATRPEPKVPALVD